MLVLTRRFKEALRVTDTVQITVQWVSESYAQFKIKNLQTGDQRIEKVNIGKAFDVIDLVSVRVLRINGCQVSVGIDAPREIMVHREEIYQRMMAAA